MTIEGLKDEIGVKTKWGIYIQFDTPLCKYLLKVISEFQNASIEEGETLLKIFLSYVFDDRVLGRSVNTNTFKQLLDDRMMIVNDELIDKMWSKIDTQEFADEVLTKNYILYSKDNWIRNLGQIRYRNH